MDYSKFNQVVTLMAAIILDVVSSLEEINRAYSTGYAAIQLIMQLLIWQQTPAWSLSPRNGTIPHQYRSAT